MRSASAAADSPWQALAGHPRRFLCSAWPWRSLGYLASGVVAGFLCLSVMAVLGAVGVLLSPVLVGFALLGGLCLSGVGYGAVERRRLRLMSSRDLPDGHRRPPATGLTAWASTRFREPLTWRELGYVALSGTVLWPVELGVICATVLTTGLMLLAPLLVILSPRDAVPAGARTLEAGWLWLSPLLGIVLAVGSAYVLALAAAARARLAEVMLSAPADAVLAEVAMSRSRLVDRFEDDRRRMERDLHDGVQRRLLGLSVQLGLARARLSDTDTPAEILILVNRAHDEAKAALAELRELVDGIHPRVLTDRGLPAAVAELGASSALPVHTDVALPCRFERGVETCAYYTISEAVTNANKHSHGALVHVSGGFDGRRIRIEVSDDGVGGADPVSGGGLQGLADRADAVGGRLRLSSPPGGPTMLCLDIPCRPLPTRDR
ncbi:MAG: sensor histidine kinase [Pseudonocardia sp.]